MGLALDSGGHLTHGSSVNLSGKWFKAVAYGLHHENHRIDMEAVAKLARDHKPKLIIAGGSAYARQIDFAAFRKIADEVGAYLMVDMAHFAGLVAGGAHPSPLPHAHIVTTTTHKTLRGPRGGMVLTNDANIAKKIDSALFPGLQGGPLMHIIAAKAVAFGEALTPEFKAYAKNVVDNASALSARLMKRGFQIISGGTDTHLLLVDLRGHNVTGKDASDSLARSGLTCNKNTMPNDPLSPTVTSGIRLGSPAGTTRGLGVGEFEIIGDMIADVLTAIKSGNHAEVEAKTHAKVMELCKKFPIY